MPRNPAGQPTVAHYLQRKSNSAARLRHPGARGHSPQGCHNDLSKCISPPAEGLGLLAFAPDGNHLALHSLHPSGEAPEAVVTLQAGVTVLALSDKYLIGNNRGRYLVYSRQTGEPLALRRFSQTLPNCWTSGGTWVNGDAMITAPIVTNIIGATMLRRDESNCQSLLS